MLSKAFDNIELEYENITRRKMAEAIQSVVGGRIDYQGGPHGQGGGQDVPQDVPLDGVRSKVFLITISMFRLLFCLFPFTHGREKMWNDALKVS